MRAVQLHEAGHPPVVSTQDPPQPREDEVLVQVLAAPITPLDLLCASGSSYFGVPRTPYVPGVQGVGTADGTLVWFATTAGMAPGDGSMAEQAAVPRSSTVRLPEDASSTVVAALGLSAVAAWMGAALAR